LFALWLPFEEELYLLEYVLSSSNSSFLNSDFLNMSDSTILNSFSHAVKVKIDKWGTSKLCLV